MRFIHHFLCFLLSSFILILSTFDVIILFASQKGSVQLTDEHNCWCSLVQSHWKHYENEREFRSTNSEPQDMQNSLSKHQSIGVPFWVWSHNANAKVRCHNFWHRASQTFRCSFKYAAWSSFQPANSSMKTSVIQQLSSILLIHSHTAKRVTCLSNWYASKMQSTWSRC